MNSSFVYDDYTTDAIYYETDSVTGKKLGFLEDDDNITLTVTGIKYPDKSGATILSFPLSFAIIKTVFSITVRSMMYQAMIPALSIHITFIPVPMNSLTPNSRTSQFSGIIQIPDMKETESLE